MFNKLILVDGSVFKIVKIDYKLDIKFIKKKIVVNYI